RAIARRFFPHVKSNFPARLLERTHQLPNRLENRSDLFIVLADTPLELGKLLRKLSVRLQCFAQTDKSEHDRDIHPITSFTLHSARRHPISHLSVGVWPFLSPAPAF